MPKQNIFRFSILALSIVIISTVFAWQFLAKQPPQEVQAQTYNIRTEHPRIFLTDDLIASLNAKVSASAPEWTQLKTESDKLLDQTISSGYQGSGYYSAMFSLALSYQLTGNVIYANKAVELMQIMVDTVGVNIIKGDSGYGIRHYGPAMAIGYDWCYDQLTADQKVAFYTRLNEWLDWYANGTTEYPTAGYQRTGPALGNYFSGYFLALTFAGYATYGDNPKAQEYIDKSLAFFNDLIKDAFENDEMRGGDDPEGEYAPGYYERILYSFLAMESSSSMTIFSDYNWPKEIIYSHMYRTKPYMNKFYDWGDWTTVGKVYATPMLILSYILDGTREAEYAKYYADYVANASNFNKVLFYDSSAISQYWDNEPLSYYAKGSNLITMRSSWTQDAIWASFQGGADYFVDHQDYDKGHFSIQRGNDYLVVDSDQSYGGKKYNTNHNSVLIDDKGEVLTYPPFQSPWGNKNQLEAFVDAGDYLYAKNNLASAYNIPTWYSGSVRTPFTNFYRIFVYMRPNIFIILDRISKVKDYYVPTWTLHTATMPAISGDTVSAVVGASKVFSKTLLPENPSISYTAESSYYKHRIDVESQQVSLNDNFLHVLYVTDSGVSTMPSTTLMDAGNMTGTLINNVSGPIIGLFSKNETISGLNEIITYNLSGAGTSKHLVVDLKPNTQFTIQNKNQDTGQIIQTQTINSSSQGTLYFTTTLGSNHQITLSPQGAIPPQPTPNITLTKTSNKTSVSTGDEITYTITYNNTGTASATNLIITDPIPAGTTYVQGSATNGGTLSTGSGQATLTWTISSVATGTTGSVSFRVKVD